jgi:hypothetical protein
MDQKEFERLTNACDLILKKCGDNYAIVAVSWLHVLNVHPNSIQHYGNALHKRSFFSALRFSLYNIAYIGYKLFKSVFEAHNDRYIKPGSTDILFISHLVGANMQKENLDFYYGELAHHAETKKGLGTITALIDHTAGTKTKSERGAIEKGGQAKYLYRKTLPFAKEVKIIRQCFSSFRTLNSMSRAEQDPDLKNVLKEASLQSIAPETFYTLRIYEMTNELIKRSKPSNIVLTWEGRAWERLAVYAARHAGSPVKCIGYQHTILLSSSHSIKRSLSKDYDPDHILTLGEITAGVLKKGLPDVLFSSYGSYRMTLNGGGQFKKSDSIVCLVTPEGLEVESLYLFSMAVEVAKRMPEVQFIFRMHPVYPYKMFSDKHPSFAALPSNCTISDKASVNDDLARCNFLLYRASSVALYAVINGLKPVYYNVANEMSIDSLYFIDSNWRSFIHTADDFAAVTGQYKKMQDAEKQEQYASALAACRQYVTAPDEAVFFGSLSQKIN